MYFCRQIFVLFPALAFLGCDALQGPPQVAEQSKITAGKSDAAIEVSLVSTPAEAPAPGKESSGKDSSREITLQAITWQDLEKWVAQHKGKVVVVDLWSTWCTSCVHEFPHFVALHRELGDRAVFASLSLDYYGGEAQVPADVLVAVTDFLKGKQATTKNFIAIEGDEAILKELKAASIPIAIVYDKTGKRHKLFKNDDAEYGPQGFTYQKDIAPLVKSLLE